VIRLWAFEYKRLLNYPEPQDANDIQINEIQLHNALRVNGRKLVYILGVGLY